MAGRTKTVPFDSKEYWDERFSHEDQFDWLLSWDTLRHYLTPYLPSQKEPILHLGCGNSPLPFEMADAGYKRIVNVDYSACVIDKMVQLAQGYDQLEWLTADCVQDISPVRIHAPTYAVVLEKSLTDCIACGDDDQLSRQHGMARQIASIQPSHGLWLCVSFSDQRQPFPPYRLLHKIPVLVPQPNDKPGAPDIYYYLYVLQKTSDDLSTI
ncbi:uncharacterized protein BX664DRAFT_289997 [Halteromyces radiatus]|uniref:uncharacterized protein n=1 Tax=Halteromyces radiatus TaxID=101107 RepID=UPI00221EAD46|nr:uncharacterized protein BX664DRAFT_289997 [Halteromyces radiatus]KAI8099727.1 hypothetical protein BX664DRAFT_289997 [Halteromyces radiatus]